jgi:Zn-dependent M28 family amino/carboxypeptidase
MKRFTILAAAVFGAACAGDQADAPVGGEISPEAMAPALESIQAEELMAHIAVLADDSLEGRGPGTVGEERTVAYLTSVFQEMGLQPGNPDGSWVQEVPLVGFTQQSHAVVDVGGETLELAFPTDYLAETRRMSPEVSVEDSELVFVGYGVRAPEYDWDDYKGIDLTGKTLVMLVNDPAIPDPADPAAQDTTMFKGSAMTYYGRWTYKYEIASEVGAAAALVIHETGPAGYPFEVLSGGAGQEAFDIEPADGNEGLVAVQGWLPEASARRILSAAGQDFDQLKQAALSPDFEPVPLGATADFRISNETRRVLSQNVVARLEGRVRPEEHVVYTAHWDHLGMNPELEGDQIYNGALDNASGTAGMLELAEAFTRLDTPPDRSVLFLAVTAEEKGLLGTKYYAADPLYPLDKTVANINMDGVNQWGRTEDIVVVGLGNSTLDDVLAEAVAGQGRTVEPDPEPEKGFFYRSDHFEFAKQGVPALYTDAGTRFVGKPDGYGQQKRDEYTADDYHKVSDEIKPDWDLAGAVEDLRLMFEVGYRVSQTPAFPEWKPGTEFKARRDAMLGGS